MRHPRSSSFFFSTIWERSLAVHWERANYSLLHCACQGKNVSGGNQGGFSKRPEYQKIQAAIRVITFRQPDGMLFLIQRNNGNQKERRTTQSF
jgi:hypothetical protein